VGKRLKQLPGYLFKFNVMKKADLQSQIQHLKWSKSSAAQNDLILQQKNCDDFIACIFCQ